MRRKNRSDDYTTPTFSFKIQVNDVVDLTFNFATKLDNEEPGEGKAKKVRQENVEKGIKERGVDVSNKYHKRKIIISRGVNELHRHSSNVNDY